MARRRNPRYPFTTAKSLNATARMLRRIYSAPVRKANPPFQSDRMLREEVRRLRALMRAADKVRQAAQQAVADGRLTTRVFRKKSNPRRRRPASKRRARR